MDTENSRTGTERDFGLSEDMESPCLFHTRALSASADCLRTRTVRVCCVDCFTDVAWLLRNLLRGCCVGHCVDVSFLLRQLFRDLPTGCQPARFVICLANFTGNCPDIYQPLRQPLRGHSSLLHEMFPATDRTLRGCCLDASQVANCLLRVRQADCFLVC